MTAGFGLGDGLPAAGLPTDGFEPPDAEPPEPPEPLEPRPAFRVVRPRVVACRPGVAARWRARRAR
ncbi:MAG: hypothetical protein ACRDQB_08080, partial [Thermocrispum sp.]